MIESAKAVLYGDDNSKGSDNFQVTELPLLLYLSLIAVLYFLSRGNYLLFHSLVEAFSISVAFAVFMLVWNVRSFISNDAFVMLGIAYFFIGGIDLLHTLAYKGMGILNEDGGNLATQLWISARYMESLSLLSFALFLGRTIDHRAVFIAFTALISTLLAAIFLWPIFPSCFVEGTGLTPFKKISEYVICFILAAALATSWRQRRNLNPLVLKLMMTAILLTILGELAFTFYISVYGFSNLMGHFFKITSFILIYIALIKVSLKNPLAILFRELNQKINELFKEKNAHQAAELALQQERALLEARFRLSEMSYNRSIKELIQLVLNEVEQLVASKISFIHFITDDEKRIFLQTWSKSTLNDFCQVPEPDEHYPLEKAGVWIDCIRQRKAVIHNDYQALPHRKGLPEGHADVVRQLVVPIFEDASIVAVLGVGNKQSDYTRDDVEKVTSLASLAWDIVSRRKSEIQFTESQRTLSNLIENLQGIVFRCRNDEKWTMEYMNGGTLAMTGYPPESLIKNRDLSYADIIANEDRDRVWAVVQDALKARQSYEIEYRIFRNDQTTCWCWERGNGVWSDQNELIAIEGYINDITDLRTGISNLQRLASAVEQTAESILITDSSGIIQFVNPAFCRVTGYSSQEVIGQTPAILKSGVHDPSFYRGIWSAVKSGQVWAGRIVNRKKDGTLITEEGSIAPVFAADGQIVNVVGVRRDITKALEHELHLQQAQKMEAIGTLSGGIAHDFNNILTPIIGYAEFIQDDLGDDSEHRSNIRQILLAAQRATSLVRQILAFSRQNEHSLGRVGIQTIAKEVVELIRATLPSTIQIVLSIDEKTLPVWADPNHLHQILMNLITNAFHAMEMEGGTLTVSLRPCQVDADTAIDLKLEPGAYSCLEVTDTGVGMSDDVVAQIFSSYFTTKPEGKGTGLGLAVVKSIVTDYKGCIDVRSEPGEKTTFRIFIPAVEDELQAAEAPSSYPLSDGNNRHILVVDDEKTIMEVLSIQLQKLNYRVTGFNDSVSALETFRDNPDEFDLVVTDMTMPGMTGLQLAGAVKDIDPRTPVIMCTGFSHQTDREKAAQAEIIDGVLYKPVLRRQLSELVTSLLSKKET